MSKEKSFDFCALFHTIHLEKLLKPPRPQHTITYYIGTPCELYCFEENICRPPPLSPSRGPVEPEKEKGEAWCDSLLNLTLHQMMISGILENNCEDQRPYSFLLPYKCQQMDLIRILINQIYFISPKLPPTPKQTSVSSKDLVFLNIGTGIFREQTDCSVWEGIDPGDLVLLLLQHRPGFCDTALIVP